jgi:limonene-1,2-epoxide hydrolase
MADDITPQGIDWNAVFARGDKFWDTFSKETVDGFRELAAPTIRYRDPLSDVTGIDAVIALMRGWFKNMDDIRIRFLGRARDGSTLYSHWIMTFRLRRAPDKLIELYGMSTGTFDEEGKLVDHIDYWDSAPMLAQFPVLGRVVGLTKKLMM